jgi:hypothetical protein
MQSPFYVRRAAFPGPKRLITWALVSPYSFGLGPSRFDSVGGWSMTSLTSIPGSKSIRVEGGP